MERGWGVARVVGMESYVKIFIDSFFFLLKYKKHAFICKGVRQRQTETEREQERENTHRGARRSRADARRLL